MAMKGNAVEFGCSQVQVEFQKAPGDLTGRRDGSGKDIVCSHTKAESKVMRSTLALADTRWCIGSGSECETEKRGVW